MRIHSLFCIVCLSLIFPFEPLAGQTIKVCDKDGVVCGAYLLVNSRIVSVSDSTGLFRTHFSRGDTLRISHMSYLPVEYVCSSAPGDTTVFLTPQWSDLNPAEYVKEFDYDILNSMLRRKLSCWSYSGKVEFESRDTISLEGRELYIEQNGILTKPLKRNQPTIMRHSASIAGSLNSDKQSLSKKELKDLKRRLPSVIGNADCLSWYICKRKKIDGFRIEYRGRFSIYQIFYFFIPPQDLYGGGSKFKGFAYINSLTGILDYAAATWTVVDNGIQKSQYSSYNMQVRYQYSAEHNEVFPIEILHTSFGINEPYVHKRHIVLTPYKYKL